MRDGFVRRSDPSRELVRLPACSAVELYRADISAQCRELGRVPQGMLCFYAFLRGKTHSFQWLCSTHCSTNYWNISCVIGLSEAIAEVWTSLDRRQVNGSREAMLKITSQQDPVLQDMLLVLEGRLAGPWVEELRTYCRRAVEHQQPCSRIDLTGVTFIDADGKLLLAQLWQQGVELRASGCLTRCLVEEIRKMGRIDSGGRQNDRMTS